MAPSSSRARNSVMKIAERSSLKILPSPITNVTQMQFQFWYSLSAASFRDVLSLLQDFLLAIL